MVPMKNSSFMVLLKVAAPVSTCLVSIEATAGKTVNVGSSFLFFFLAP